MRMQMPWSYLCGSCQEIKFQMISSEISDDEEIQFYYGLK